jgi:hypothetical protein
MSPGGDHFNDRDHTGVLFHSTRRRVANAGVDMANVYQSGELTEVAV